MLTLDKIYQASFALKTVIRRTDLISAPNINPDSHIYLKPENLQITGSFKVRGACFKIAQLTEEEKAVYRRGRNANSPTMAKNATMSDYRKATGFEAWVGYLYVMDEFDRILFLIKKALAALNERI